MNTDSRPLFIFELANNHMGSVEHGLRIIEAMREASEGFPFRFAVKLQYRDLATFIHPDHQGSSDVKFVKRFRETALTWDEFARLRRAISAAEFLAACTPFDEASVGCVENHDYDLLKIASCSLTDWPLLERVASWGKPIILSTAGMDFPDIDRAVSFFQHRQKRLVVMHCVGEYPTPNERLALHQIELLRKRYSDVEVGYSTHEDPGNFDSVRMAIGCGATVFEKHVGVETPEYKLNAYSANPEQVRRWLESAAAAFRAYGRSDERYEMSENELSTLAALRRGAFARVTIAEGERLSLENVFFAIPGGPGQIYANDFSKYTDFCAKREIQAGAALLYRDFDMSNKQEIVHQIVADVRNLIATGHVMLPKQVELEISHHYGIESFPQFGCTIITVVNREYCKKLIALLPGQNHPEHCHRKKEETFLVVYGEIAITLDGTRRRCRPGDLIVVERGVRHSFATESGAIMEELSSTHYRDDSFYTDPRISGAANRKTLITYWLDSAVKQAEAVPVPASAN